MRDIVVIDIGLGAANAGTRLPELVDEAWTAAQLPPIAGTLTRGPEKARDLGGARGMAGASGLAARSALRSGVGMEKLVVANESVAPVQESEPQALCAAWPTGRGIARDVLSWADAIVIGPGAGLGPDSEALLSPV